jgi:S1-C subfamily serine protease
MRRIILSAALILGSCGCAITPQTSPQEQLLTSRHSSLVETPRGTGSGFPISDTAFLTAWHVVEYTAVEDIVVGGWNVIEVIRLEGLDAALLVTGLHGQTPWPLANRAPRPGERVFKSGYGAGQHWWTEGIATEDPRRVAIDIFPGDSGCPLFDADGKVLGIVVMIGMSRRDHILHHCYIVPMTAILPVLDPLLHEPAPEPVAPLPAGETTWERFLRLRKERLGY